MLSFHSSKNQNLDLEILHLALCPTHAHLWCECLNTGKGLAWNYDSANELWK